MKAKQVHKIIYLPGRVCLTRSPHTLLHKKMPILRQRGCIIVVINQGVVNQFSLTESYVSVTKGVFLCGYNGSLFFYTVFSLSFLWRNHTTREPQHSGPFIHEFYYWPPDTQFFTPREIYIQQAGTLSPVYSYKTSRQSWMGWQNPRERKEINFKESGPCMRNGTGRRAPLGTLFAVKTTAVISPNTGKEAIIVKHQHAVRVHAHAQTHTCTKAHTHTV